MESKALISGIVLCLAILFALAIFWGCELSRDPVITSEPTLEVKDVPLLSEDAKQEARETGNAYTYIGGKLIHIENVPGKYLED